MHGVKTVNEVEFCYYEWPTTQIENRTTTKNYPTVLHRFCRINHQACNPPEQHCTYAKAFTRMVAILDWTRGGWTCASCLAAFKIISCLRASCFSIFVYKLACALYSGPSKITLFFKVMQENRDEKGKLIGCSYLKKITELERRVAGNRRPNTEKLSSVRLT